MRSRPGFEPAAEEIRQHGGLFRCVSFQGLPQGIVRGFVLAERQDLFQGFVGATLAQQAGKIGGRGLLVILLEGMVIPAMHQRALREALP